MKEISICLAPLFGYVYQMLPVLPFFLPACLPLVFLACSFKRTCEMNLSYHNTFVSCLSQFIYAAYIAATPNIVCLQSLMLPSFLCIIHVVTNNVAHKQMHRYMFYLIFQSFESDRCSVNLVVRSKITSSFGLSGSCLALFSCAVLFSLTLLLSPNAWF